MATVTKSIGSAGGRDYSTIAGWAASLPANLVTDGNSYVGQCYNDSEFVSGSGFVFLSGHTTDASHTIKLTTGPGQSFRDNAGVQTNALKYNQANGVGLRETVGFSAIMADDTYVTISNLQIKCDNGSSGSGCVHNYNDLSTAMVVENCILETATNGCTLLVTHGITVRNTLMISDVAVTGASMAYRWSGSTPSTFAFCTWVLPSDVTKTGSVAITMATHNPTTFKNCAVFGFETAVYDPAGGGLTSVTCMCDLAAPAAGWTGSKTYASQFQNTTTAARDWREKTGADLRGAGTADATNGAFDIAGTARPQGGNWDIGAWEFGAVSSMNFVPFVIGVGPGF